MVQQVVDGLGGDARLRKGSTPADTEFLCYHINCRLSDDVAKIGQVRWKKVLLLLQYCSQAIYYRYRFGVTDFLCVPAPPFPSAIHRDWLMMSLCRCFFRRRIFYWQASGLGDWLRNKARPWERWLTWKLLGKPDLSIVLGESSRSDAVSFGSRRTAVVPNAIPDPCSETIPRILEQRAARAAMRAKLWSGRTNNFDDVSVKERGPSIFKVLFLGLCIREKGLFDAVEAIALVNRKLARANSLLRMQLGVAGRFWTGLDQQEFEKRIHQPDLAANQSSAAGKPEPLVKYLGFVTGEEKTRMFREFDCFCLPTYYSAESFPLVLIEAMAYGMDIIATNWRNIPELLPLDYPGIVEPHTPEKIVSVMELFAQIYRGKTLRERFEANYMSAKWLKKMKGALNDLDSVHQICP